MRQDLEARYLLALLKDSWTEQAAWLVADRGNMDGDTLEAWQCDSGWSLLVDGVPVKVGRELEVHEDEVMVVGKCADLGWRWEVGGCSEQFIEMINLLVELA